jgi:hypothetical protein
MTFQIQENLLGDVRLFSPLVSSASFNQSSWQHVSYRLLDGGGIRGYSSLLILKRLMDNIILLETEEPIDGFAIESSSDYPWDTEPDLKKDPTKAFYPCHYFDYIAGTSTGG